MKDETAREAQKILDLIDTFGVALHAQDLAASLATLDPGTELTVIPSEGVDVHRGPDAVRAFLSRIYDGPRRYGWRWKDRWVSVEGRTAWFVAVGDETIDGDSPSRTVAYCLTGVAVRTTAGWRLSLLHGSEDQGQNGTDTPGQHSPVQQTPIPPRRGMPHPIPPPRVR